MVLHSLVRQLVRLALTYGVIGLGLGTFVESLGIPFADLTVQLAAGTLIRSGRTSFLAALLVSTTGLVLGSVASYYLGYFGSTLRSRSLQREPSRLMQWFASSLQRHGIYVIALAQLYGPARTWISIPAGAARMDLKSFVIATTIGGAIYCSLAISLSIVLTRLVRDFVSLFLPSVNLHFLLGFAALLIAVLVVYKLAKRQA